MTTGHVFLAMSLDGFVARPDHRLDWLMKQSTTGEDHGYDDFVAGIDGIVMGSGSFRTALGFDPWPYERPVVVLSGSLSPTDVPAALGVSVSVSRLDPAAVMRELADRGWRRAYIDGGRVVQSFLREGLVEDMTLTLIPILLGEGIRPFGKLDRDIDLELLETRTFPSGLLQTRYRIAGQG